MGRKTSYEKILKIKLFIFLVSKQLEFFKFFRFRLKKGGGEELQGIDPLPLGDLCFGMFVCLDRPVAKATDGVGALFDKRLKKNLLPLQGKTAKELH